MRGWRGTHTLPIGHWLVVVAALAGAGTLVAKSEFLRQSRPALVLALLVFVGAAMVASLARRRLAGLAFAVLLIAYTVVCLGDLNTIDVVIDVQALLEDGIDAALAGSSPYGITVPNLYNEVDTATFYGPGMVENGRVDVRLSRTCRRRCCWTSRLTCWGTCAGCTSWRSSAAGAVAWQPRRSDRPGRVCAVLVVVNPLSTTVLMAYWVEPVLVFLLALTVVGRSLRGHRWTGPGIGTVLRLEAVRRLLHSCAVVRRAQQRLAHGLDSRGVGAPVVGAFFLCGIRAPSCTRRSRPTSSSRSDAESMSLLPGLDDQFGPLPEWMLAISPVVGLVVSPRDRGADPVGRHGVRARRRSLLLVTVLLSKQAHINYYFPWAEWSCSAVIAWDRDDPIPDPKA